jgi:hypothetical protein
MNFPSPNSSSQDKKVPFQPYQIVCLKHGNTYLYAEVVQIVEARQVCWARPLMLVVQADASLASHNELAATATETLSILDLRQGADLLLPIELFHEVLDTELIPLITQLNINKTISNEVKEMKKIQQQLNQFVHEIYQSYPNIFNR